MALRGKQGVAERTGLRSGLCGAPGCQEIPVDRGGAEILDAGAGGFGGGGVADFFLGVGELIEGEEGTRVGGERVDGGGEIAFGGEYIAAGGFETVGDQEVAGLVG